MHSFTWPALRMTKRCGAALILALLALAQSAHAQNIRLVGTIGGSRAIVIVDEGRPRTLSAGDSHEGVRLVSVQGNTATFDVQGAKRTLTVGQVPTHVGQPVAKPAIKTLTLEVGQGGHYFADGAINGKSVRFMVDTGASTISLDAQTAQRLGLDLSQAQPIQISTANGFAQGLTTQLAEVDVGSLKQRDVQAIVVEHGMPYVLLGNSFLNHYDMTRNATSMTLKPR